MNLRNTMLNKIIQAQRYMPYDFIYKKFKNRRNQSKLGQNSGYVWWDTGRWATDLKRDMRELSGATEIFCNSIKLYT